KLYPVKARPKFTGFETLKKQDRQFRKDIGVYVNQPQFSPLETIEHNSSRDIEVSYKVALVNSVKQIDQPLVYLSGGLDSEIVANAFIDSGKTFIPLIYYYVDDYGNLLNKHDIGYAYAFCKRHGLFPVIKQINLTKLWNTQEFKTLAIDLQIVSPQLVTYAYMIQQMSEEYPDHTHVFGGEVRFQSNYQYANRNYNIVFLDKLVPAYDGEFYSSPSPIDGSYNTVGLIYYGNSLTGAGTWEIQAYVNGFPGPQIVQSGVWTTTPALGPYEVIVTDVTVGARGNPNYNDYFPKAANTPFNIPIAPYAQSICFTEAGDPAVPFGQSSNIVATFIMLTRVVGEVSPAIVSSITLQSIAENGV
ncbi:hypothetical protein EBU71_17970, partial [bacterium]|nr:hypothetical protein [Candidatus Elulimicrobium humile]